MKNYNGKGNAYTEIIYNNLKERKNKRKGITFGLYSSLSCHLIIANHLDDQRSCSIFGCLLGILVTIGVLLDWAALDVYLDY